MSMNINTLVSGLVIGSRRGLGRSQALKLGVVSSLLAGENATNAILFPMILADKFRRLERAEKVIGTTPVTSGPEQNSGQITTGVERETPNTQQTSAEELEAAKEKTAATRKKGG